MADMPREQVHHAGIQDGGKTATIESDNGEHNGNVAQYVSITKDSVRETAYVTTRSMLTGV